VTDRTQPDFAAVDRRLRQILEPLRSRLSVTKDGPGGLVLEIPGLEGKPWGYVAGIRHGKRYASYYLMSLYVLPELADSMSPALRRRMQGKSCFNFTRVDEPLFDELAHITRAGFEPYLAFAAEVAGGKAPARSRQEVQA
jgi:hypothetical protein